MKKLAVVLGVSAALGMGVAVASNTDTLIVNGQINEVCSLDLDQSFASSFDLTDSSNQKVAEVGIWCNDLRSSTDVQYDVGTEAANSSGFRRVGTPSVFIPYQGEVTGFGSALIPPTGGVQTVNQPSGSGSGLPLNYAYSDIRFAPQVDGSEQAGDYVATITITVNP